MNKDKCLTKKDIIVIIVNLLVLTIVIYAYYIVENLKTILSHEAGLSLPKTSQSETKNGKDGVHAHIRNIRSTDSMKFQHPSLFTLAQPNIDFEQNGILGPWILSNKSLSADAYSPLKLTSRRTLFEIVDEGLYLVHIQVYYLLSSKRNSFAITKITAADVNETLSVCSAVGAYGTEISCFTSVVENFKTGDSVLIRLREMTSNISLSRKPSHTYLGFTKIL